MMQILLVEHGCNLHKAQQGVCKKRKEKQIYCLCKGHFIRLQSSKAVTFHCEPVSATPGSCT